ncbi:unnamed protein product [Mucor hiemalis]
MLFVRPVPLVAPFFRGFVRAFPKYYYPGVSNYYGFPGFMVSKIYTAVVSKCHHQNRQQKTHTRKTIAGFEMDVKDDLSKYTTFIPTYQARQPNHDDGMIIDTRFYQPLGNRTEQESRGLPRFRYLATSVVLIFIHFIITKEKKII